MKRFGLLSVFLGCILLFVVSCGSGAPAPKTVTTPTLRPNRFLVSVKSCAQVPKALPKNANRHAKVLARSHPTITTQCFHRLKTVAAPTVGEVLSTTAGTWSGSPTSFTYQWEDCNTSGANCAPIAGAQATSYTVTNGDVGSTIVVLVTACNSSGCATQKSAATGTVNGASVPLHTENYAYVDAGNGGTTASNALIRQWVNIADVNGGGCGTSGCDDAQALSACHAGATVYCLVYQYFDTNLIYNSGGNSEQWNPSSGPNWSTSETPSTWRAHEASPNQAVGIAVSCCGATGFLANSALPAVRTFDQSYMRTNFPNEDGIFMDDEAMSVPLLDFASSNCSACTPLNEFANDAAVQSAQNTKQALMTKTSGTPYQLELNSAIPDCGSWFQGVMGVGPTFNSITGNVAGVTAEGCPTAGGALTTKYEGMLDDMAWVDANSTGHFNFLSYGDHNATTQTDDRLISEATELLGYKAGQTYQWPELEQVSGGGAPQSNLELWPESGIYPTAPVQTMASPSGSGCLAGNQSAPCPSGGHNTIKVSGSGTTGIYRREFTTCYNQGVAIGNCAAIMNSTGSAVTVSSAWLTGTYTHMLSNTGGLICNGSPCTSANRTNGDVQSGGTINPTAQTFTPNSTQVPATSALILLQ